MTLDEALSIRKGDVVVHRATAIALQPMKVAEVWVNERRTIVLIRLPAIGGAAWLDATGYEWPPEGCRWCRDCSHWHTRQVWRSRHPEYRAGLAKR